LEELEESMDEESGQLVAWNEEVKGWEAGTRTENPYASKVKGV
jgi:hypothetical protein